MASFEDLLKEIKNLKAELDEGLMEDLEETATEAIAETQSRTDVVTGNLRRSWTHSEVVVNSNNMSVELGSDLEYAEAYEEGHSQEIGKYIPAIGKRLVKSFVEGKHVLRDSITVANKELDKKVENRLNKVFEGWS
ncbi:HK97 gp10 family phage protein [Clostridium beijerinckii]|uniref:HK97 gp10 family phage protein n=1 Tax=Clostridium beijerinckii TaxID=1520 RepID=UPI00098C11C3|nr:HK97 gp10 family phage protein [Clostridium beijerinckii]NRT78120.1 hypothetical protein [Clostridium beijerinckii]OOM44800.1 hypothetical protein CBEIJ_35460 [Clostridium beijerinckii]